LLLSLATVPLAFDLGELVQAVFLTELDELLAEQVAESLKRCKGVILI